MPVAWELRVRYNRAVVLWDPTYKPCLRPLEAFPVSDADGAAVGVYDRSGLSDVSLTLSGPALRVMGLMDGANTCEDIRRKFVASYGRPLSVETLQGMLEHLERAHMLEGSGFEAYYQSRLREYRSAGLRDMPHAAALGITGDSGDPFDEMLADAGPITLPSTVLGVVVPHLDYPRGRPCYVAAYGILRERPTPDRVVILGTNHFGRSTSVVATANDFVTPLGKTRTDAALLERLEVQCSGLRACELDHLREHSIELQVIWLQHLFGPDSFEMVPVLCPDPCGQTGTVSYEESGIDLRDFALALGELIRDDGRDTLIVAGADFSHVGPAFGDERPLDDVFLEEVRQRDKRALDKLAVNDPTAFLRCVAEEENVTRICSAGCVFALSIMLPQATGTVLQYHQAVDQASQTCVTCAAVAFT